MEQNAGDLSPINHWHLVHKEDDANDCLMPNGPIKESYMDSFMAEYNSAEKMLDAWIGCTGMQPLSKNMLEENSELLKAIDWIGAYKYLKETIKQFDYRNADLSTLIDINLILGSLTRNNIEGEKYILEVGGGYGRIAEAILNVTTGIKYVLVDAVPGSLIYSYEYLRKVLPEKRVGFYYLNDAFDMSKWDVYIIPAWHFEKLNKIQYDECINISSMQEMGQWHVDYYLNLFDNVIKDNGVVYLQNSHDYVFKGVWNYGINWERVYMYNSIASWTPYYPTEIFVKRNQEYSTWNHCVIGGYKYVLQESKKYEKRIENMKKEIDSLNKKLENQKQKKFWKKRKA